MCLKKYYRPPEAMPKFLPFLDLAKIFILNKCFMCLKKYYRPPEAMPKVLPFLDLAKVTFWTKGFVLEETIKPLGVAGGYVQFYRMDVCDLENSMAK